MGMGLYNPAMMGGMVLFSMILIVAVAWSMVWKGLALWRAGRNNQLGWFIALLLINTMGILEIVYLLTAGKKPETKEQGK